MDTWDSFSFVHYVLELIERKKMYATEHIELLKKIDEFDILYKQDVLNKLCTFRRIYTQIVNNNRIVLVDRGIIEIPYLDRKHLYEYPYGVILKLIENDFPFTEEEKNYKNYKQTIMEIKLGNTGNENIFLK